MKKLKTLKKTCGIELKLPSAKKSPDWTMPQLEKVLGSLKRNIARDSMGWNNEVFMPDVAGSELKSSLLHLMNKKCRNF